MTKKDGLNLPLAVEGIVIVPVASSAMPLGLLCSSCIGRFRWQVLGLARCWAATRRTLLPVHLGCHLALQRSETSVLTSGMQLLSNEKGEDYKELKMNIERCGNVLESFDVVDGDRKVPGA